MNIKKQLKDFKSEFDPILADFFAMAIAETERKDKLMAEALRHIEKITMSGGKRLRPALFCYGYLGVGGRDKQEIIKASISVELIHSFLLIHDDIIDRDATRHNVMTTHLQYKKFGEEFLSDSEAIHFGNSMAMLIGDAINIFGNQQLLNSDFKSEIIIKAMNKLQIIINNTIAGQIKDMAICLKKEITEKDILQIYKYKTAKYTIESPLHLGAILGGASDEVLQSLSKLAILIGIAFQIQDDILGIFGSEKKIGKPVGSDISEGKQTVLISQARKKANEKQKNILENILGEKNLTKKDIEDFRKVIIDTGALEYAKSLAQKYVIESKKEIVKSPIAKKTKDFLIGIADYMMEREV